MNNNKKCFDREPWLRAYYSILQRCKYMPIKKYKDIECNITREELKELWFRDKAYNLKNPSIDRKDTDKHYTINNCRFIERKLNNAIKKINKLNFNIAQKIRQGLITKTPKELSEKYGVSKSFISDIKHNKWYKPELYLTQRLRG